MILPPDFFQLLTQFAANHPVGGSLTAQVLAGAAKRALTTIWRGRPQDNLFDALWKHTVSEVGADWPALRLVRVARIRGAFAKGKVVDLGTFRGLLLAEGVNESMAETVLEALSGRLQDALIEAGRDDDTAFRAASMNESKRIRELLEQRLPPPGAIALRPEDREELAKVDAEIAGVAALIQSDDPEAACRLHDSRVRLARVLGPEQRGEPEEVCHHDGTE
jgi:hypothetical protein